MADFSENEVAAIKGYLASQTKRHIGMVNGRPFDFNSVRAPQVSEDAKHKMYADPRLMLKDKTKPSFAENRKSGVEYCWINKGSFESVSRKGDYRAVLRDEVDMNSPFCRLDPSDPQLDRTSGKKLDIVSSGGFELYEVGGDAAYMLKQYGADKYLTERRDAGDADFQKNAQGTGLPLTQVRGSDGGISWDPGAVGNLSQPETWGAVPGKFV